MKNELNRFMGNAGLARPGILVIGKNWVAQAELSD
jgi:hypothetical protein